MIFLEGTEKIFSWHFCFLLVADWAAAAKYLYRGHITAPLEGGLLSLLEPKPEMQVFSAMSPWRSHFHVCIPQAWVINILASLILWELGEFQILITRDIKTVKPYESFLFLLYVPAYLLLLCCSRTQALWL